MIKSLFRKITAWSLILTMTITLLPAIAYGTETQYPQASAYNLDEQKEIILNNENVKNSDESYVTFPLSGVGVNVGEELVYHIFRQGNSDNEQTVTLASLDLSASYGEDYEIIYGGKAVDGKANPLLNGKGTTYDVYLGEDVMSSAKEDAAENIGGDSVQSTVQQLEENASCKFDITFAKGEQVKEIRIRAKKHIKAVGNKEFQLSILECKNGLNEGNITSSAITLADSRDVEESKISIDGNSAKVVDGYVTVIVKRTGNTDSYTSYNLTTEDGTAENGKDYILKGAQLMFTPGVSKQRVYIPLTAASKEGVKKSFTLKTDDSEETVTYRTTKKGVKSFTPARDRIDIPLEEFEKGSSTVGSFDFKEDGSRYEFSFHSGIGDGSNRSASIRTKQKYDFTGIEKVCISASYKAGTVLGDHLDVYASNTDYYNDKSSLGSIEAKGYGRRIDTLALTGQGIEDIPVYREGEYNLYMTAEQHGAAGWIGYYLYNQEFDGGDDGHVALIKKRFNLEILDPESLGTNVAAGDMTLTLTSDSNITDENNIITAYRDEVFKIGYTLLDQSAHYAGYELLDEQGHVYYSEKSTVPTFTLTSEIIQKFANRTTGDTFRIRPVFDKDSAEVEIISQDFQGQNLDNLTASIDMNERKAVYRDGGTTIATVTWNTSDFTMGQTLQFNVEENNDYGGDYHFTAYGVRTGKDKNSSLTNTVYYSDKKWSTVLENGYYEIMPIITNQKSEILVNVSGATHGDFIGKPENLKEDTYTVRKFEDEGNYGISDVVTMSAKPDDGYRARWSYRDVATGNTKTYYGNMFYYQIQAPAKADDNWVSLDFIKSDGLDNVKINTEVYMQGGDIMHQPEADSVEYSPLNSAIVSIEGTSKETGEDGSAGVFEVKAKNGDSFTALVRANNRYYVEEVKVTDTSSTIKQVIKLPYYYAGPRVTSVQYYDYDGTRQNGDTIYLEGETDGCIIGATIDTSGKDVTDVIYKLKSKDGTIKGQEYIAERNGAEYIWSASLGMIAEQGDQIWIELVNRTYDDDGNIVKSTSYGEVNTGYIINIAEFTEASYLPDTGLDDEFNVPLLGNLYFNFAIKGIKPVFTVSTSGNMTYLTIGVSGNYGYNIAKKKGAVPSWSQFTDLAGSSLKALGKKATQDEKIAAKQTLKKHTLSVSLSVSAQLALYNQVDEETSQSRLLCVGAYMSMGFNAVYMYNIPIIIEGVPFFVAFTISGGFSDTVEIWADNTLGYEDLVNMHDPTKSSYKPENDLNGNLGFGISLGVGVNGLADIAGGGTGKIALDWVDFTYGKGTLSLSLDAKLDVLIFGGNISVNIANYQIFNTNPYLASEATQKSGEKQLMRTPLKSMDIKNPTEYDQKIVADTAAELSTSMEAPLISDAYEFSKPRLLPIGNNKYMIVATVDGKLVGGLYKEDGTEIDENLVKGKPVLAYAIYDKADGNYEKDDNGKIFRSLEPVQNIGDSINFHPSISKIGAGKCMITWNSIETGGAVNIDKLNLSNTRSVIKSAVIDYGNLSGEKIYKSLVLEDAERNLMSGVAVDTAYDSSKNELILLYRVLNHNGLNENSTLENYLNVGSSLMYTSIDLDNLNDNNVTYKNGIELATSGTNGSEKTVIKDADIEVMDDGSEKLPVITYHMTKGPNANILSTGEEDSSNYIYVSGLEYQNNGYVVSKTKTVTEDNETYNSQPQLIKGKVGTTKQNMLLWRQDDRIAVVDPVLLLNDKVEIPTERERNDLKENESNDYYTASNMATITNKFAGSMADIRIFNGYDGNVYAMWSEGTGEGTKIMMSSLERDGSCSHNNEMRWSSGSPVLETKNKVYVQHFSPIVDNSGQLWMLYKDSVISEDSNSGSSNIVFGKTGIGGSLTTVNYSELSDSEIQAMDGIENLSIWVSNNNPLPGEKIIIKGRVKNEGIKALKNSDVQLYADGNPVSGAIENVENIGAGEEAEVEFEYTVPDDFASEGKNSIAFSISTNGVAGQKVQSVNAMAEPVISSIKYHQLNYVDDTQESKYRVRIRVRNDGNIPSDVTHLTVSHLQSGKANDGSFMLKESVLTSNAVEVPSIDPGDEAQVEFELTVPPGYFSQNALKLAPVGIALYEDYGTSNQNMVAAIRDYIQANEAPEAKTLTLDKSMKLGVGQSNNISAKVGPEKAQIHTKFRYESSDEEIATVDENGIITGIKPGRCTITVLTKNGLKETMSVHIVDGHVDDDDEIDDNGFPGGDTSDKDSGKGIDTGDEFALIILLMIATLAAISTIGICFRRKREVTK